MFCKWCGMESTATDLCSWCHRPLSTTTTDTASPAAETPMKRVPLAGTLVEEEPEEEAEEESPLAAGITPERSVRRPAPAHRPAWAPVPRAGSAPVTPPPAATQTVPPTPAPANVPVSASATETARPVIGVRRSTGTPASGNNPPASGSAGIGVRRPTGTPPATTPPTTGRPSAPNPSRPALGANGRPATPAPVPAGMRPAASSGPAPAVSRDPFVRTPATPASQGTGADAQAGAPANRTVIAPVRPAPAPLVTEEEEGEGLASGMAAGKRPAERQAGIPTLGDFTPVNSKYYDGQVVDPMSGNQYNSVTGQATSAAAHQKPEDIVLNWDDPSSTPLHFGRFGLAFAGLLIAMTALAHLLPDYAAIPLVIVMFVAGLLLPVMRAVPFHSDDSDDLVWMILLTLLFGPSIGLLIYSVKAFLLRDMNIAVLGLLIVGFLGYITFQLASPLAAQIPDANEGLFNMIKLAPPWSQVGRYGYTAVLYNWGGLVAMVGWMVGNVFHKLDE